MKKVKLFTLIAGIISLVVSFVLMLVMNVPTMKVEKFSFKSTYNENQVTLKANYYEADNPEYAVLICPGYSCDKQKWRPIADIFKKNNMSVMSFDYSGQAASYGRIGFDNAKTDAIPVEIDDAIEVLHNKSNIDYDHIVLLGHSMGGRSILRLLQDYNNPNATTTVTKKNIKNVILMAPEVNYNENAQASLFAGTNDAEEYPWKDYDPSFIGDTNVYLFGSTADDVVNDEDILKIYRRLVGDVVYEANNVPSKGACVVSLENPYGTKVTVGITKGILHSYQMYSPEFAGFINIAIKDILGHESSYTPSTMLMVYFSWGFALIGLFLTLFSLNYQYEYKVDDVIPEINDTKKFLLNKLLMWLPGIGIAFLICCLCIVMPFGSPVMNIPYMCFIAGYGVLMLLIYSVKKFNLKGVTGKLTKPSFKVQMNKKDIIITVITLVSLLAFAWYILHGSMYSLIPLNIRIFWVIFASILMTIGYYISGIEEDMLTKANASKTQRFLYSLIQYVPLFLFALFYAVIGSYSGLIGQVQNLVLMYIFCIPLGNFIRRRTNNRLLGAFTTAFIFQTIMITSAAIISMF